MNIFADTIHLKIAQSINHILYLTFETLNKLMLLCVVSFGATNCEGQVDRKQEITALIKYK